MNGYQGQIRALDQQNFIFSAGQELLNLIRNNSIITVNHIKRIGIYAPQGARVLLNNQQIEIGKTNIYEVEDVEITSLKFVQDSSSQVIIDFIIE